MKKYGFRIKSNRTGLIPILVTIIFLASFPGHGLAHEPLFGLGPHTIFKGGIGIESKFEKEHATGSLQIEGRTFLHTEIMYGITGNVAITLSAPTVLNHTQTLGPDKISGSGIGDISLRTKYRFWRNDKPGMQNSAAVILGIKLPTGDYEISPPLGSGSTDYLFAITAAHESRRWYYFGDVRYRLNTRTNTVQYGNYLLADAAFGVRPWLTEYMKPDLVVMIEANWESLERNKVEEGQIADSGGKLLFISPGFFLTYRNWAFKGGLQIPVSRRLNGAQPKTDYRFALAIETHF